MPRTPPTIASPDVSLHPPDHWTVHLKTITPMFGGSAQTRQVDEQSPVRPASVRGHLRFWWRATAGAAYQKSEDLFQAESEIWGNTDRHGKVRAEVEVTQAGRECAPIRHTTKRDGKKALDFGSSPAYALFPFQGTIKSTLR